MSKTGAEDFLKNMIADSPEPRSAVVVPAPATAPTTAAPTSRAGRKHIGGYLDDATVEKVAVLRARLKLDNSELIKRAIDDLHQKHTAKRAFGDV